MKTLDMQTGWGWKWESDVGKRLHKAPGQYARRGNVYAEHGDSPQSVVHGDSFVQLIVLSAVNGYLLGVRAGSQGHINE